MNPNTTKTSLRYADLAQHLRRQIETEVLRPGDRMPSLRALQRELGVTQATVDKAHSLLESEGLIVRSPRSGVFVARPGERPATGIIGFCYVGFSGNDFSPYWTHVIHGAEAAAQEAETQIMLLKAEVASGWQKIDGALLLGSYGKAPAGEIRPNMPVVSLFCPPGFSGTAAERQRVLRQTSVVTTDDYSGMRAATEHLLELGHRRIAYLNNSRSDQILYPRRQAGYLDALKAAGVAADPRWQRALPWPSPKLYFMHVAREAVQEWLRDDWGELGCTALLAHNDDTAWGAMESFREAGLTVPADVSVVGFDSTEIAACCSPALTSVEVPLEAMGRTGVELLLQRIRGEGPAATTVTLPTSLQVRGSTAAPPDGQRAPRV